MTNVKIDGLQSLLASLKLAPAKVANSVLRGAMRDGAKVIANQASQNIKSITGPSVSGGNPNSVTGNLKSSIRVIKAKRLERGQIEYRIVSSARLVKRNGIKTKVDGWYARLVEFGHATRGGGGIGWVAARPFMRPAYESRKADALAKIAESARARFESTKW